MSRHEARLGLSLISEPGDPRLVKVLASATPAQIVAAARSDDPIDGDLLPRVWIERARDLDRRIDVARTRAAKLKMRWVCPSDSAWPKPFADLNEVQPISGISGSPVGVWVRGQGNLAALSSASVAIVGARSCSTYGAECASDMAADLSDQGLAVVSGAAYGIDACAHRGALATLKPTIAVLACGADIDYPKSNAKLLERIAEDGLIVSEQAPGEGVQRSRFLARNRLIAAMSLGTVVIEAARRSGSLNTLNWADQLGRSTMAMPGPVTSALSSGTHEAVRQGMAVLVTNGHDVIREVAGIGAEEETAPTPDKEYDLLSSASQRTLDVLGWTEPLRTAEVAEKARLARSDAAAVLTGLEQRGLVIRLMDGWILHRLPL